MINLKEFRDELTGSIVREGPEWVVKRVEQGKAAVQWRDHTFHIEVDANGWLVTRAEDGTIIEYIIIKDCDDRGDIEYYIGYVVKAVAAYARESYK